MSYTSPSQIEGLRLAPLPDRPARWNQWEMSIDREFSHDGLESAGVHATILWRFDDSDDIEVWPAAMAEPDPNDELILPDGMGVALTENEQAQAFAEICKENKFFDPCFIGIPLGVRIGMEVGL